MSAQISALPQRIRERIVVDDYGHWQWMGYMRQGYPVGPSGIQVKRTAWVHCTGEVLSSGDCVIRECQAPRCVNPDHHFIGSHDDALASGRKTMQDRRAAS